VSDAGFIQGEFSGVTDSMNQRPKWLRVEEAFRQVRAKANINAIIKPFYESELPIKSQFKKKLAGVVSEFGI
jgi:hypothetical protein